jgi:FkbM family methyltransferase
MQTRGELVAELLKRQRQNQEGGWDVIWQRRLVWVAQVIQKLGLHREVTVPLFWGDRMRVITGETVSSVILAFGYTELALTALMLCLLDEGQTMVDVGTHFGYEALLGCRLVGSKGRIVCFEPSPATFSLAKKNLLRFPQVELYQKGVGDQPATLRLQHRPIWDSAFNSFSTEQWKGDYVHVPVTTLDLALAKRSRPIDFIKCDAEGFEMAVLKGAHRLLLDDAPIMVLEGDMPTAEGRNTDRSRELADRLSAYGYQAYNFDFTDKLLLGPLDSFPVHHANVAFVPQSRSALLSRLAGTSV